MPSPSVPRTREPSRPATLIAVGATALALLASGPRASPPPNVVVIVVDTLRADHLKTYGYETETAPFLSALARESVVFSAAQSTSAWTAPATASLFTSLYPFQHNVVTGFMVQEMPDPLLFKTIIGSSIQKAAMCSRTGRVRVYGEMVNLLWRQNLPAAQRLEVLWNEVILAHSISLFCAYHVDGDETESRPFPSDLRAAHSHLIPVEACA